MIDVIVTVYNTPLDLMKKCFTSIEKQTYQDWRAIIVDDGSNEETKNFIDDYIR